MNKITFNLKDDNMEQIQAAGKFGFETNYSYRCHGLQQADRPAILIQYTDDNIPVKKLQDLKDFFNNNKIKTEFKKREKEGQHQIYCGLREDVRKEIKLCNSILNTVIFTLEGKLKLVKTKKVKCIPFQ